MRLKSMDGPLAVHNGNNDILNSPKRINTLQNSNVTINYNSTTRNYSTSSNYISDYTSNEEDTQKSDLNVLNNVAQDKVQWCNLSLEVKERELANNNANNRNNRNINISTLAASVGRRRPTRHLTAPSICSIESSPDDSLLDYADAQQSCSSTEATPQDEDRAFDVSDSESSEDGNLSNRGTIQRRGIVNPNYPGFQHLAHTLDFKTGSDTDFDDDDLECDAITARLEAEANNNNNVEDTGYNKIDSVNRLDSVENIQKVFYEKEVFNLEEESDANQISESSSGNANTSDEDTEIHVHLNIKAHDQVVSHEDIVGDFRKEVEAELGKVALQQTVETTTAFPVIETAVVLELEQAVEKLQVIKDLSYCEIKYNIEPNISKLSPSKQITPHEILEDTEVIQNTSTMPMLQEHIPTNPVVDVIKIKIQDAFLSNAKENIPLTMVDSNLNVQQETKMEVDNYVKQDLTRKESNRELEEIEIQIKKIKSDSQLSENICKEQITEAYKEKEDDSAVPRKKEKVDVYVKKRRDYNQQFGSLITFPRKECGVKSRDPMNRRSVPMAREKKRVNPEALGGFDVYNIETAMPKIDLEAIECHLRAAREEERRVSAFRYVSHVCVSSESDVYLCLRQETNRRR